jgi:transposase
MHDGPIEVTGGVDTHTDVHVAAVVNGIGQILGTASFDTTLAGYRQLLGWMSSFGQLGRVGVEGTGAYGAGLTRHLQSEDVKVVEVNRPNRQNRRRRGKSDTTDAEAAARAALNGEADAIPKAANGPAEAIRVLRATRRSAIKARTQASNQLRSMTITAPDQLRDRCRDLETDDLIAMCAALRPGSSIDPLNATKVAMRTLARRHLALTAEVSELDVAIKLLCAEANPALLGARGVGAEVAATLLVTAGDNPHRMHSEAAFAALCGASPVEASSGRTIRHRLNQGGDRQANNALWRIVMVRLTCCDATRAYAARRRAEGKNKREIIRYLKRYVAREIYQLLTNPPTVPHGADLRATRQQGGHSLATAATALGTWPTRISDLERGLTHNTDLAQRYDTWLASNAA